jgi:MoxR-like ATPase
MSKTTREKLLSIEKEMNGYLKERREQIRGLVLAILSRVHLFLLGPAGTAKTLQLLLAVSAIRGADTENRLMHPMMSSDELFGPPKLSALKKDKFERALERGIGLKHFVSIDEIWKGPAAALNSLLKWLNERRVDSGSEEVDSPLECCLTASNELPEEDCGLSPLFDRFVLRYEVPHLRGSTAWTEVVFGPDDADMDIETKVKLEELHKAQEEVKAILIGDHVMETALALREELLKEGLERSARRYKNAMKVVKASAYLNGRAMATLDDLEVLRHVLWDEPGERQAIDRIIMRLTNPAKQKAQELWHGVMTSYKEFTEAEPDKVYGVGAEVIGRITPALDELNELCSDMESAGKDISEVEEFLNRGEELIEKIQTDLGILRKPRRGRPNMPPPKDEDFSE